MITPRAGSRRGITLVETMVIITIVVLLLGILLPAIDSSRCIGGRRTQTLNNLRNASLGVLQYVNAKGAFPGAGTYGNPGAASHDPGRSAAAIAAVLDNANNGGGGIVPYCTGGRDATDLALHMAPRYSWVVEILPYIDQVDLANGWDKDRAYNCPIPNGDGGESNLALGNTPIPILESTADDTTIAGAGNLSFGVNGGFARGQAADAIAGYDAADVAAARSLNWTTPAGGDHAGIARKLGVFSLGTAEGNHPRDNKTRPAAISDGASNTVMMAENVYAGVRPDTEVAVGGRVLYRSGWACPHPNFAMIFGSDKVCAPGPVGDCTQLAARDGKDAPGWGMANDYGRNPLESINGATRRGLKQEGRYPFPNGRHDSRQGRFRRGVCVSSCDGSMRWVSETVDGTVWSRALTPAGGLLPLSDGEAPRGSRQLPQGPGELDF